MLIISKCMATTVTGFFFALFKNSENVMIKPVESLRPAKK